MSEWHKYDKLEKDIDAQLSKVRQSSFVASILRWLLKLCKRGKAEAAEIHNERETP